MVQKVVCKIEDKYQIIASDEKDHQIVMDIKKKFGGEESGFMPMPVMLAALGGCLSVDVKLILEKMRCPVESVVANVNGNLDETVKPHAYGSVDVEVIVRGDIEQSKLEQALQLAEEKYCNVSIMFKKIFPINTSIKREG